MFLRLMLAFVPICIGLAWFKASPLLVFVTAALAIVPLANQLAQATERVAGYLGDTVGGLLNASLGNAPEVIIGAFALKNGLPNVVKGSITGSILMNLLIAPGLAMILGGWRREKQKFNRTATRTAILLLMLAAIGLIIPSVFQFSNAEVEVELSREIAIVLFILYALSLVFTLFTHRHLFAEAQVLQEEQKEQGLGDRPRAGLWVSLGLLAAIAVVLAVVSEVLTDALDPATKALGLSEVFAGVIVVGVLGNIAELFAAIRFARSDKMDLAMASTLGASTQVALVVAPALLFISYAFRNPMDLEFTLFEVVAITLTIFVVGNVTRDGESNWFEGTVLVALYALFALGFYFMPGG
ncbi:MAG: calcium/proton exchanger [Planctomycetales bacterium]